MFNIVKIGKKLDRVELAKGDIIRGEKVKSPIVHGLDQEPPK